MILLTGAAGYVGSHCALALFEKPLLKKEQEIVIIDDLSTGHYETIETLKQFGTVHFEQVNLTDKTATRNVFKKYDIDKVLHFAGFNDVAESVKNPSKYYYNNVSGSINLLNAMLEYNVKQIVFSSTAEIYGDPIYSPIDEKHPQSPKNPYGKTKLAVEQIIKDFDRAYGLRSVRLRYFNVTGADSKQRLGEWRTEENHIVPNLLNIALGMSDGPFKIYGDNHQSKDGTLIRDYVDVEDLAKAHQLSLNYLVNGGKTDFFNIGSNEGKTVKEIYEACKLITGKDIPCVIESKREMDSKNLVANNKKAKQILNWEPQTSFEDSITNAYKWKIKLNKHLQNTVS